MSETTHSETEEWIRAGRQALVSGTLASALSTAVLAWLGRSELGKPAAPTNATSGGAPTVATVDHGTSFIDDRRAMFAMLSGA